MKRIYKFQYQRSKGKLFATQALSQTQKNVSEPQTGIESATFWSPVRESVLIYQAASHPSYIYIHQRSKLIKLRLVPEIKVKLKFRKKKIRKKELCRVNATDVPKQNKKLACRNLRVPYPKMIVTNRCKMRSSSRSYKNR